MGETQKSHLLKDEKVSCPHRYPYFFLIFVLGLNFLSLFFFAFRPFPFVLPLVLNLHRPDISQHKSSLLINKSCCQSAIVSSYTHEMHRHKQLRHFLSSRYFVCRLFGSGYLLSMCGFLHKFMWQTSLEKGFHVCLVFELNHWQWWQVGACPVCLSGWQPSPQMERAAGPVGWSCSEAAKYSILTTLYLPYYSPSSVLPAPQLFAARFAAPGLPVAPRPRVAALWDDIIWPPCCPH